MSKYLIHSEAQNPCKTAKWIAPKNSSKSQNFYFRTRTKFELSKIPEKSALHICAESYYLLYINGIEVGRGPARGTHTHNYYDSYEVASLLKPGNNVIAALVQCMNYDTFIAAPAQPGVIIALDSTAVSNSTWEIQTAKDWRSDVDPFTFQVGASEWHDLRLEPIKWTIGKDSTTWKSAWEIPNTNKIYTKKLLPRDLPALAERTFYPTDIPITASVPANTDLEASNISAIMNKESYSVLNENQITGLATLLTGQAACTQIKPGPDPFGATFVVDFDTEITGRFEMDLTAPEGTVVDICYNETLKGDRLAVQHAQESYHFTDRYILREGQQKIGNSIFDRGFKMVQIVVRNFNAPIKIHQIKAIDNRYPFVERSSFHCNDLLLNQIWDACCLTLESCTTDIFTDCPWRERAFWVNDLIVENKTSLQAFGASEIHRRAFRLAFSDSHTDGLIPGVCPGPAENDENILLPTNLFIILMLKDYFMYSHDTELIKEFMPNIISILEIFSSWEDQNGIIVPPTKYWNFLDWSFEMNKAPLQGKITSLLSYLYIIAMKTIVKLAEMTNEKVDLVKYQARIKKTSSNLEKHFFKKSEKRLADWLDGKKGSDHSSQLAHAFALLSGECSPINRHNFEDALDDKNLLMPELYLHYFIFHAMKHCGKETSALKRIRKYWGDIIKTGSPTIWEAGVYEHGKNAFGGDGSLCHGFATSPIDFFQTVILGIEPLLPGFENFKVEPQALGLNSAEGRIPTPHGNIFIKWEQKNDHLKIRLKVPAGTVAKTKNGNCYATGTHDFNLE